MHASVEDILLGRSSWAILAGDAVERLGELPAGSVDLVVSSPPYNLGVAYDGFADDLPFLSYLEWHQGVLQACRRVLKDGGRLVWQVGASRDPTLRKGNGWEGSEYFPLNAWVQMKARGLGLVQRYEIVWDKGQRTSRTAWGTWRSPKNNNVIPSYEYVEVFHKGLPSIVGGGESDLTAAEFTSWTNGLWRIAPETGDVGHPAPFPVELARRAIKMNSFPGALVVDPFVGSGSSAVAAVREGRRFLGFDRSVAYVGASEARVRREATAATARCLESYVTNAMGSEKDR